MTIARAMLAVLAGLLLCAATEPPSPPPSLAAYIADGRFDPGDYGWMRGAFADASEAQRQSFREAMRWSSECRAAAQAEVTRQLAEMGYGASGLEGTILGPLICRQVMPPPFDAQRSFAEFDAAVREARPVADGFLAGVRLAHTVAGERVDSFGHALIARTVEEQALRLAVIGWGRDRLAAAPQLPEDAQVILEARLNQALIASDYDNTEWLKKQVAQRGWPKISEVGRQAANSAWLLVQHADSDPVFQAQMLRLMEPLAEQGEVSGSDYAYLYDRVMLKLTGKQRYGTQWASCTGPRRELRPLEDAGAVAEWRRKAGMPTVEENAKLMDQLYGPCGRAERREEAMERDEVKARLEAAYAARVAGDGPALEALFAKDARFEIAGAKSLIQAFPATGPMDMRTATAELMGAVSMEQPEIAALLIDGHRAAVHLRARMALKGLEPVETELCQLWEFDEAGKVRSLVEFVDTALLVREMAALR